MTALNNWVCSRNRKLTAVVCSWRYWLTTFNRFSFSTETFWVYLPTYTCMSICNRISVQKCFFFCGWGLFIYQWHNCWKETYFICCWGFFPFIFFKLLYLGMSGMLLTLTLTHIQCCEKVPAPKSNNVLCHLWQQKL